MKMEDEPPRLSPDDVTGLREDTRYLADSIHELAERQTSTETKVDDNIVRVAENRRLAKRANINSAIALIALALVVVFGLLFQADARHKTDQITRQQAEFLQQRADNRVSACNAYNTDTVDKINGMLHQIAANSRNPEATAKAIAPLLLVHRVCTTEGITAWLAQPQQPGAYETTTTTVP